MLSSRFLKLADAEADHKAQEHGFLHWIDTWYTRRVNWALDHPGLVIGLSIVTFLLAFPLNRMVGREFVPTEDMGEWTVHMDAPEGTSLEGSSEIAFKLLDELSGIEGVAHIEPSIAATGYGGGSPRIRRTGRASTPATRSEAAKAPAGSRSRPISWGRTSTRSPHSR